jgi:hypothetical protein
MLFVRHSLRLIALSYLVLLSALASHPLRAQVPGEAQHVTLTAQPHSFALVAGQQPTPLCVAEDEWPGVAIAAQSFREDVNRVTGTTPALLHCLSQHSHAQRQAILIGTIGHSALIERLIATHQLDVSAVRGHWEMSVTTLVEHPLPGIDRALVIAGADKRGTIFGIYDLSEQIGVSPWYWWADVPVPHRDALYVTPGTYLQPQPAVQYRGIFLNDEEPALGGWARAKFGGFNHQFYTHVFELLLRLKANFLWPAMWDSAFNEDDPLNPKLADEYGIVMGTSHHEPMMRSQQEWKRHGKGPWDYTSNAAELNAFWRAGVRRNRDYEELTTIGMRGDGDMAMSASTNTKLLESIVADQRRILAEEVNPDVTKVPQVWALYKEVQSYYEAGMRVPDDVTLLWSDDNWGNIRRLPTAEERRRAGGAGVYYHFDYVGDPRDYKWLNTVPITKVWEQMHLAVQYGATREWIANVGDLKPMEFPISFFLAMARTPERWGLDPHAQSSLDDYTRAWAAEQFGPKHADEIADLLTLYTQYNSRRKPEQLEPTTFSLTDDHEADRIDADWRSLTARAEKLNDELPAADRPGFFELVLYPLKASAVVNEMYIDVGRANLFAQEGRASANYYAQQAHELFHEDAALSDAYNHKLLDGRWDHMMDQTHIGYTWWQEPPLNAMPAATEVQPAATAQMVVVPQGSAPIPEDGKPLALPAFDAANRQTYTIALGDRSTQGYHFTATTSAPWILLSASSGEVPGGLHPDTHLQVSIDWAHAPQSTAEGTITITQEDAHARTTVGVTAQQPTAEVHLAGFVEDNHAVTIDAEHAQQNTPADGLAWHTLPGFGLTHSGMETFPVLAPSTLEPAQQPCLAYTFTVYTTAPRSLETILAPTMNFQPGHGLRYAIALDDTPETIVDAWQHNTLADWSRSVSDGVHKVITPLGQVGAGTHTLHVCRVDAGVVLERFILYSGPLPGAYLGPRESAFIATAAGAQPATAAQQGR